jgi:hypothetical protein
VFPPQFRPALSLAALVCFVQFWSLNVSSTLATIKIAGEGGAAISDRLDWYLLSDKHTGRPRGTPVQPSSSKRELS